MNAFLFRYDFVSCLQGFKENIYPKWLRSCHQDRVREASRDLETSLYQVH
jgi:hypothetical protein